MDLINKKIEELTKLLNRYANDELSLLDLDYLDEQFDELMEDIKRLKEDIVNDRFIKSFDNGAI
jgi:uncharacterized small protein (DUF1192 family)